MASTITIAFPQHMQPQSPLLNLPLEIKIIIYKHCLVADRTIIDPITGTSKPEINNTNPTLGVTLLQTCRRIYHEVDHRPLFSQNRFRFTAVDRVRCFFSTIGEENAAYIHDVDIDARRVHSDHPSVGREWLHYLKWGGGTWAKILGSLRQDAPNLKCLRLNFESWPSISMFRSELWILLRSMLLHVEGLERVVVSGRSKGPAMARQEPWSSIHFVGSDLLGPDDLVQRMWRTVGPMEDCEKILRWQRSDGRLQLEVVSLKYLVKHIDSHWNTSKLSEKAQGQDSWPQDGACTWSAYQNRNQEILPPVSKNFNPTAVE